MQKQVSFGCRETLIPSAILMMIKFITIFRLTVSDVNFSTQHFLMLNFLEKCGGTGRSVLKIFFSFQINNYKTLDGHHTVVASGRCPAKHLVKLLYKVFISVK